MTTATPTIEDVRAEIGFEVTTKPLQTAEGLVSKKMAIVRVDNEEIVGVVSTKYGLMRYVEAFDVSVEAFNKHFPGAGGYNIKRSVVTRGGSRMYVNFEIAEDWEVVAGDKVRPVFNLSNSYDGTTPFGFMLGATREVCTNGLRSGTTAINLNTKHYHTLKVQFVKELIEKGVDHFANVTIGAWRTMAQRGIKDYPALKAELEAIIPKRINEIVWGKVKDDSENIWELYNHYTQYFTHTYNKSYDRSLILDGRVSEKLIGLVK